MPPPPHYVRGRINDIVPATRYAPGSCQPPRPQKNSPRRERKKGKRSAERRIQPCPAPSASGPRCRGRGVARERATEQACAERSANRLLRARSPFGAHASGACQNERTLQLSPGRASRDRQATRALPAPSIALKRNTPRAGRNAGGKRCPNRPRTGLQAPPAGTALAPWSGVSRDHVPYERDSFPITEMGTRCQGPCLANSDPPSHQRKAQPLGESAIAAPQ